MKVIVRLDLRRYTLNTVKRLYWENIISRDELTAELEERGMDALTILTIVREERVA